MTAVSVRRLFSAAALLLPLAACAETVLTVGGLPDLGIRKPVPGKSYSDADGVIHLKGDQRLWGSKRFDIDPGATYTVSGEFRASPGTAPATLYFGFAQFNGGRLVNSMPVNVVPRTQTKLVKDVSPDDLTVEIASPRGWSTGEGCIAVFGAEPDFSDLPNYRYTKPCFTNILRRADGSAVLQFPKRVGVSAKAGEGVREHRHGGNYHYAGCLNIPSTREWTNITGRVKGISPYGLPYGKWWRGAEKACVLLLANYRGGEDSHLEVRDVKVVKTDHPAIEHARAEFARLYRAVAGREPPAVRIGLSGAEGIPAWAEEHAAKVRDDGYALVARGGTLAVVAKRPRGCLYGVYDWFHRFAGARWYYPGKDGEKLPRKPSLAVADCTVVDNPAFTYREFNLVSSYAMHETIEWMVRNRMQPPIGKVRQALRYIHPPSARYDERRYDTVESTGGHVFSSLLDDALFAEHPEAFAEVKGRRVPQKNEKGRWQAQPCATDPYGLEVIGKAAAEMVTERPGVERLTVLNNDCGGWCGCARCVSRFGTSDADRFWNIANVISRHAGKANPRVMVDIHGYQTFQGPPATVKPSPDADVNVCVHHRCYVHSIGDPGCPYNERYRRIMRRWRSLVRGSLGTYEYTNCLPGWGFLPIEKVVYDDINWYHALGCVKYIDEVLPLDGISRGKPIPKDPYRGYAFLHYVQARALWDPKLGFDALFDEYCDFVYGPAAGPMKRFRTILRKGLERSRLYLCYGSNGDELWRCLPNAKVVDALKKSLAAAATAAADDPVRKELVDFEARRFSEVFLSTLPNRFKPHRAIVDGRPEFLINGGFEFGAAGWGGMERAEIVTGGAHSGTNYVSAANGALSVFQAPAFSVQTYCSAPLCEKVRVTGWFRGTGEPAASVRFSDRRTNSGVARTAVSSDSWKKVDLDIDTSGFDMPPLYVFISIPRGMDADSFEVTIRKKPGQDGDGAADAGYIPPVQEK